MNRNQHKGLSLIEVMISVFIMSTFILGAMSLQLNKAKLAQVQQQYFGAWLLMQDKLAELRIMANLDEEFALIQTNSGGALVNGELVYSQYNYSLNWQVTNDISDDGMLHIKAINVVVSWQNKFGDAHKISEETLVAIHYGEGTRKVL